MEKHESHPSMGERPIADCPAEALRQARLRSGVDRRAALPTARAGEVRVRVLASGIEYTDVVIRCATLTRRPRCAGRRVRMMGYGRRWARSTRSAWAWRTAVRRASRRPDA